MLAPLILLTAVFLLLSRYYKPNQKSHTRGGSLWFPSDVRYYAVKTILLFRKAQAWSGSVFSAQVLAILGVWCRGNELNKAYLNMPESILSFGHGMNILLNKILDPSYMNHLSVLLASLARYVDRAEARQHTSKCTVEETHRCALEWTIKGDIELFDSVSVLTHKVMVRTLMGDDFYDSGDELLSLLHAVESDVGNIWSVVLPDWVPNSPAKRLRRARERVHEIFREKLGQRDAAAVAGGPLEADLPDYITHTLNDESTAPLRSLLPSHHIVLMFAAQRSTVAAISWVIVCLLRHPDVMNAVKRDARSGNTESALIQACIKESIRYYDELRSIRLAMRENSIPSTGFVVSKDPADSVSSYLMPHDPVNYPHPDSWLPGRWLNAENKLVNLDEKNAGVVKSSTLGSRCIRCPGERMAMAIVTQTLATLMGAYDLSWVTADQPRTVDFEALDFDKVGSPWLKGGLRVKISRRVWPEMVGGC